MMNILIAKGSVDMRRKMALLALVTFFMLAVSGCQKSWYVDFTKPGNLADWIFIPNYEITPEGLILDDDEAASPRYIWTGDFTVTVKFVAGTDEDNHIYWSFWVGDGHTWYFDYRIATYSTSGGSFTDSWQVWTQPPLDPIVMNSQGYGLIPGTRNGSLNTWTMKKDGDHFIMKMNGTTYAEWDEEHYLADDYIVTLNSVNIGTNKMLIKSIRVDYNEGSMTPF